MQLQLTHVREDTVLLLELTETMAAAEIGVQQEVRRYKTLPKPLSELSGTCTLSRASGRWMVGPQCPGARWPEGAIRAR